MTVTSYLGAIGAAQREAMEADEASRALIRVTFSKCLAAIAFVTRRSRKKSWLERLPVLQ